MKRRLSPFFSFGLSFFMAFFPFFSLFSFSTWKYFIKVVWHYFWYLMCMSLWNRALFGHYFACSFNESKIIELNDISTVLTPFVIWWKKYIWAREAFNFCLYLAFINYFLLSYNNLSGCLYLYFWNSWHRDVLFLKSNVKYHASKWNQNVSILYKSYIFAFCKGPLIKKVRLWRDWGSKADVAKYVFMQKLGICNNWKKICKMRPLSLGKHINCLLLITVLKRAMVTTRCVVLMRWSERWRLAVIFKQNVSFCRY